MDPGSPASRRRAALEVETGLAAPALVTGKPRGSRRDTVRTFARAFTRRHTYDFLHNGATLFGFLWGLPVPLFALLLDERSAHLGSWLAIVRTHPYHLAFLAHPFLFAAVFGALGTLRRDLADENLRLIAELTDLAITDPLTGVYNRRYVLLALRWGLARAARTGERLAVVLFDLDSFKAVNDERGHGAGDRVLREVALALQGTLRESEPLGRYGGDEFLMVMMGRSEAADELVSRARAATYRRTGIPISAGVARWPEDGATSEALVNAADARLAREKERKRGEIRSAIGATPPTTARERPDRR